MVAPLMIAAVSVAYTAASGCGSPERCSFLSRHGVAGSTRDVKGYTVTIDPGTTYGVWEGWGTSLCWWANVFGDDDVLADLTFSLNTTTIDGVGVLPGLGLNIARYNAGASSDKPAGGMHMQPSPNIPAWKQLAAFWTDGDNTDPASASWDWGADPKQLSLLFKAQARGANLLELFSNSPVWWMCRDHNPSGSPTGSADNLEGWNAAQHATYLATVAAHAASQWNISFQSVEAFNEPIAGWWKASGTQEGCHFDHSTQAEVAVLLRHSLDAQGLHGVAVAASDENTYDMALATWRAFNSSVKAAVQQVNTHGYQQGEGRRDLLYAATTGKRLWNSEYGEGDGTGLSLASNLNLDFQWLHNTAWVYWQVIDPASGWGLLVGDMDNKVVKSVNNKYFVLAQYSRHIRPGHTIVSTDDGNTVAALDRATGGLTLVTTNYGTAQDITYNLAAVFAAAGGAGDGAAPVRLNAGKVSIWTTNTNKGGDQYVESQCAPPACTRTATTLTLKFAANTVCTLKIDPT